MSPPIPPADIRGRLSIDLCEMPPLACPHVQITEQEANIAPPQILAAPPDARQTGAAASAVVDRLDVSEIQEVPEDGLASAGSVLHVAYGRLIVMRTEIRV